MKLNEILQTAEEAKLAVQRNKFAKGPEGDIFKKNYEKMLFWFHKGLDFNDIKGVDGTMPRYEWHPHNPRNIDDYFEDVIKKCGIPGENLFSFEVFADTKGADLSQLISDPDMQAAMRQKIRARKNKHDTYGDALREIIKRCTDCPFAKFLGVSTHLQANFVKAADLDIEELKKPHRLSFYMLADVPPGKHEPWIP